MPTIFSEGYKFRFYSTDRTEPPHMHAIRGENVAKIWLMTLEVEYNRRYNERDLNRIVRLVQENRKRLLEVWYEHFGR
ncbi:MAG: DUF4160 domain-containing protein [Chloroflexi bacterium]|nr:DUF4160 domain-containing protein [Chloroflexota bacterium]